MKTKILFPVLAGLAFTACNSEDELFMAQESQQTSPITLTVTKSDGTPLSKAEVEDGGSVVTFELGDKLSLFHNVDLVTNAPAVSHLTHNAIYEGVSAGTDAGSSALKFETQAMVREGKAILVYPADLTFAADKAGDQLWLHVAAEQDDKTKETAPYLSDVVNIDPYGTKLMTNAEAGYGRNYDVPMKKVSSTFVLELDAQNLNLITDVATPLEFGKARITNGTTPLFNTKVQVVSLADSISYLKKNDAIKYSHMDVETSIVEDVASQVAEITSTDYEKYNRGGVDRNAFTFTVLPKFAINTSSIPGLSAPKVVVESDASITIESNYGKVTVVSAAVAVPNNRANSPLIKEGEEALQWKTLAGELSSMLGDTWAPTTGAKYKGANTGARMIRQFQFDMKNLDMNGLVIKDSQHLIDVLKVYQALGMVNNATVASPTLIFNADDPTTQAVVEKEFVLTADAMAELAKANAGKKISLDAKTASQIIVLEGASSLDNFNHASVNFTEDVNVKMIGKWALAQNAKLTKVASLEIAGEMTLTGKGESVAAFASDLSGQFDLTGKLTVADKAYICGINAKEGSTITVPAGARYYADAETSSNNSWFRGHIDNDGVFTVYKGSAYNVGTIANNGEVSCVEVNNASFSNGGIITNENHNNCVVYITKNTTINTTPGHYGRIIMAERNDEVKVKDSARQGYIQYSMTAGAEGLVVNHKTDDKFNYLVIDVTTDLVTVDLNAMQGVNYLKITGKTANVKRTTDLTIEDLIVDSMRYLSANASFTVTDVYVYDFILHADNFKFTNRPNTYDSTTANEVDKKSYKGEIRNIEG